MSSDLILFNGNDALPAHLANTGGLGNDNVGVEDMTVPRINLLQQLSPQVNPRKTEYVKGAEPGKLYNTVTNQFYDSLLVINLYYDKSWTVFRRRELGPMDFQGNHPTEEAAIEYLKDQGKNVGDYEITETANHYLLLLDDTGAPVSPAILSMNKTKLSVSRKWNTDLQLLSDRKGVARFGSVWKLSGKAETRNNNEYFNIAYEQVGWANEALTQRAMHEYQNLTNNSATQEQDAA